jgi:hypothetical protein
MIKVILGVALLASPFFIIFTVMAWYVGLIITLKVWGLLLGILVFTALLVGLPVLGISLLECHKKEK